MRFTLAAKGSFYTIVIDLEDERILWAAAGMEKTFCKLFGAVAPGLSERHPVVRLIRFSVEA